MKKEVAEELILKYIKQIEHLQAKIEGVREAYVASLADTHGKIEHQVPSTEAPGT